MAALKAMVKRIACIVGDTISVMLGCMSFFHKCVSFPLTRSKGEGRYGKT
jgi:hypothetical protein